VEKSDQPSGDWISYCGADVPNIIEDDFARIEEPFE
jgi:hypothetical protein